MQAAAASLRLGSSGGLRRGRMKPVRKFGPLHIAAVLHRAFLRAAGWVTWYQEPNESFLPSGYFLRHLPQ